MGYETNPQQAAITSSNGSDNNSTTNQNGGGGYGGLSAQDGVNPFQAAMNRDANDTVDNKVSNSEWKSNNLGNTKSNDDWNNDDWGSPAEEPKQVSPRAAKQVSPRSGKSENKKKVTKQDSWGNDTDEWENWLNDDSTSYKSTPSPRATKKGD